jgi:hypothetical protein
MVDFNRVRGRKWTDSPILAAQSMVDG